MPQAKKQNIILIGMPGSGKSTVGVLLAKELGLDFLDTDIALQKKHGLRLAQMLADWGYNAFLAEEQAFLAALSPAGAVVATGGSAVCGPVALPALRQAGLAVWLDVPLPVLEGRLGDYAQRGIAFGGASSLAGLFSSRRPLYAKYADIVFAVTEKQTPADIAGEIAAHVRSGG